MDVVNLQTPLYDTHVAAGGRMAGEGAGLRHIAQVMGCSTAPGVRRLLIRLVWTENQLPDLVLSWP